MGDAGLTNRNNRQLQKTLTRRRRTLESMLPDREAPEAGGERWTRPGPPKVADRAMRGLTLAFLVAVLTLFVVAVVNSWKS